MAEMDEAWSGGDWAKMTLMSEAFSRNARLEPKLVARLGFGMIYTGRFQEALHLLLHRQRELANDPHYWRDLARTYAGLGQLALAQDAIERCFQINPDLASALKLKEQLSEALDLDERLHELDDWPSHHRLVDLLYGLGAMERAADVVHIFLRRRLRPAGGIDQLLGSVQMALSVIAPERVYAVIRDLQYMYDKGPERHLLRNTLDVITGKVDQMEARLADQPCKRNRNLRLCVALAFLAVGQRPLAVSRLGRICERFKEDWESRLVLGRAVGEDVLSSVKIQYRSHASRRLVFDLFPFNNERELLKVKLAEESPWVDYFVLVEANRTFTGLKKPFYFDQWKDEFQAYADKIIHVKVDSYPEWVDSPWARDFYQRDMAVTGASGLWGVDDLVLVTDADEIVDRRCVDQFDGEYAAMLMETFRFFLNYHSSKGTQYTGVMFKAKYLQKFNLSYARFVLRSSKYMKVLDNCGWHFTSVADPAGVAKKMRSYAHQEYAHMDETYFDRIFEKIRSGRKQDDWDFWEIDERFPAFVRENQDALAHMILPAERALTLADAEA